MDRGAVIFGAALFVILCALTSIASSKIGEPDTNGAVAAAIRHDLTSVAGVDAIEGRDASFGSLVLCIGSAAPLDIAAIARELAGTIIKPVAADACTSETVEGDFGMFNAITNHYVAGDEAAHLEVARVSCSDTSTCVVDIDRVGSGDRYVAQRKGQVWSVVSTIERWVV
jgi:hypothetical protein